MANALSTYEPLLTTAAVAKWLGISTRAVCLWAECKELPAIKVGRQWRFRREELREWLESSQGGKALPPGAQSQSARDYEFAKNARDERAKPRATFARAGSGF